MRRVWRAVLDPRLMMRLNGAATVFWVVMIPVSIWFGWVKSVTYVSALSLWALVAGHLSTWQAGRVEVAQAEDAARREAEDVPGDVAERLVRETNLERDG